MTKLHLLTKSKLFKSDIVFIFLFFLFAAAYYHDFLGKGPINTHIWRQTDSLSLTQHYANGAHFFSPEMHTQLGDDKLTGKTAGEFPILYYLVGKVWSLFGESHLTYRLFYLFILFFGLYAFYKSLKITFRDSFWANCTALLLFTSPVYVFYGVSFLTDVPAMSFSFIAIYFLIQYSQKQLKKLFFTSMIFFALAGLLKVSSLMAFVFVAFIFVLELFPVKTLGNRRLFNHRTYEWFGFSSVLSSILLWYYYASYYNTLHNFKYTFNSIYPLWMISGEQIHTLIVDIRNFTSQVFFSRLILILFVFLFFTNLLLWKRIPLMAYLMNALIPIGASVYCVLWAPLLGVHDYYYSALLILLMGILIPFLWCIKTNYPNSFKSQLLKTFMGLFLTYNFFYCFNVTQLKTGAEKNENYVLISNHDFVDNMTWTNWDIRSNWYRYERMKPYIKTIGINKEDKVICMPDPSFNSSLYLLGQKGWTNYENYTKKEEIEYLIKKGAKYLFLSHPDFLKKDFLAPFLKNKVGEYEGVQIFKL